MKEKQESLRTTHESRAELIEHEKDLCEVCDFDLYHNDRFTKRVGMVGSGKKVTGWMCPNCESEFDFDNKIVYIYGQNSVKGDA